MTFFATDTILDSGRHSILDIMLNNNAISLANGVEILSASQRGFPKRYYALQFNVETQTYKIGRIENKKESYYPLLGDNKEPMYYSDFKLVVKNTNDVIKKHEDNLNRMVDGICLQHKKIIFRKIYSSGFESTTLDKLIESWSFYIPFYSLFDKKYSSDRDQIDLPAIAGATKVDELAAPSASISDIMINHGLEEQVIMANDYILKRNLEKVIFETENDSKLKKIVADNKYESISMALDAMRLSGHFSDMSWCVDSPATQIIYNIGEKMTYLLPALSDSWKRLNIPNIQPVDKSGISYYEEAHFTLANVPDKTFTALKIAGEYYKKKAIWVLKGPDGEPYGKKYTVNNGVLTPIPTDSISILVEKLPPHLSTQGNVQKPTKTERLSRDAFIHAMDDELQSMLQHPIATKQRNPLVHHANNSDVSIHYIPSKNIFFYDIPGHRKQHIKYDHTKNTFIKLSLEQYNVISSDVSDGDKLATLKSIGLDIGLSEDGQISWLNNDSRAYDIPKKIISVWIGDHPIPDDVVKHINLNASRLSTLAGVGREKFKYKIYLSKNSETYKNQQLLSKLQHVEIIALEDSDYFKSFSAGKYYQLYEAELNKNNKSSAGDILKYQMLKYEGGFYMDINSKLKFKLKDADLRTTSEGLVLGGLTRNKEKRANFDYTNHVFGSHSGNPTLDKISDEFVHQFNNPSQEHTGSLDMKCFNDVISNSFPVSNQYKNVFYVLDSIPKSSLFADELMSMPILDYMLHHLEKSHVVGLDKSVEAVEYIL